MAVWYVNYLSIRLLPIKKKKVIYLKSLWDFTLTVSCGRYPFRFSAFELIIL